MAGYLNAYRKELKKIIELLPGEVFRRSDLYPLRLKPELELAEKKKAVRDRESNDEKLKLNRALRYFINDGDIIKIGYNIYSKAKIDFIGGKKYISPRVSPLELAYETLTHLKVDWEVGEALKNYNEGKTTQVPVVASVRLKSRFRGRIKIENREIIFDGKVNAR